MTAPVRVAAARCLQQLLNEEGSLPQLLTEYRQKVQGGERALLAELCYGTIRHYWQLQGMLTQMSSKPLRAKDRDIELLILIGLYQLRYMNIGAHAAVNETVAACDTLKKSWARKLVNALLRRYQRESDALFDALSAAQKASLPDWMFDAFKVAWPDHINRIAAASTARPPLCLRVNSQQSPRDSYTRQLTEAGIAFQNCRYATTGIRLDSGRAVERIPGFETGAVSVQDEAAQLAAGFLPLAAGQTVLDMCAAPGGKTCHLLEREPGLTVVAADLIAHRLTRVQENLTRLSQSARLLQCDGKQPPFAEASFDHILLDAPCSGSGVLRRYPDIRVDRHAEDIAELTALQSQLLAAAWPLLKPGGELLYVTCSILPAENEQQAAAFLAATADAVNIAITSDAGFATDHGQQLLPDADSHDGFFFARFQKAR